MRNRWRKLITVRDWPIAWKLALTMVAIFIVGLALISVVGDVVVRDNLLRGQERELLERASQQADQVREFRDGRMRSLYSVARRNRQDLLQGDAVTRRTVLLDELAQTKDFLDLSLLDGDGQVLASTNLGLEGQSLAPASWLSGVRDQVAGVSHIQSSRDSSFPIFVFYTPVPTADGFSSLALVGRLPATAMWELVDPIRVRDTGYAFMSDENGVTIAHGLRDAKTGQQAHAWVLAAIGDAQDPQIGAANEQHLYGGQEITRSVKLMSLAAFIKQGVPTPSVASPAANIVRYYWDVQRTWKTAVAVPVGEPEQLAVPHQVKANDWVLCITVFDGDFLLPLTRLRLSLLIVSGASLLLVSAAVAVYSRTITRPIRRLAELAGRVREGAYDERVSLKQGDELGQLATGLDAMLDRLVEALAAQRQQLETLLHTADQVLLDAETVSTSAEELAAATEELQSSAEEVAGTVQSMARDAYEQMNQVQRTAGEIQGLDREISRVDNLSREMEASSGHMRTLAEEAEQAVVTAREHSRRIEAVVRTIEKFSRQTNMLALNATIEASRAGEMGESFDVVAEEVRRLAEGSRQALSEVGALNEAIRQSMATIGGTMGQTKEAIVSVVVMAGEMARTASRQAAASRSLVEVINQLAAIAEKNAAGSEQMAAAVEEQTSAFAQISTPSQELAGLAQHLRALAQRLVPGKPASEEKPHG